MEISIIWCQSESNGREFPVALFSADTDMETIGMVSLTSINSSEVVVAKISPGELSDQANGQQACETRVNNELGRSDLRIDYLVDKIEYPIEPGLSFQEFRSRYKPPILFHRDIYTPSSRAREIRKVELAEFKSSGGVLNVL